MSPILNVDNFPGEIVISDCTFSGTKVLLDFTMYFDSNSDIPLDQSTAPVGLSRFGFIEQSLILVSSHAKGFTLTDNTFYNISTISGTAKVEILSDFEKGVLIANN